MHFRIILQVRLSSTRFPQKAIKKLGKKTLIEHILERYELIKKKSPFSIDMWIATTHEKNPFFYRLFYKRKIPFLIGDPEDVYSRFYILSLPLKDSDYIIRLTGDNPFFDGILLLKLLKWVKEHPYYDYIYPYGIPLGMGFEIIKVSALKKEREYPLLTSHKEHVTTFIKENRSLFSIKKLPWWDFLPPYSKKEEDLYLSDKISLTVDYLEDLLFCEKIYKKLPYIFHTGDIQRLFIEEKELCLSLKKV